MHIVGNRPQFIKLAVLYRQLALDAGLEQKIIHTGQHYSYNMSELFFKELTIPEPDVNLSLAGADPALFFDEAVNAIGSCLQKEKEAAVFVYGDTNTTLAGAKAANKNGSTLLHFEAGVRTYDNSMPEEINRVQTDRLADVNYCCTAKNLFTMEAEGFTKNKKTPVVLSGDLMLDAFLQIEPSANSLTTHKDYIVCTIHRQANLSDPARLKQIINTLNQLHKTIPVVMPLHPHTKLNLERYGLIPDFDLLPPLGYPDMKSLLKGSQYIITDSGGTSREAYFLEKKSLIIMDHPFWPEIIEASCSLSCAADESAIIKQFDLLPALEANFSGNIFGNGKAAINIHQHLIQYFQ